jgi:hypothetical protein
VTDYPAHTPTPRYARQAAARLGITAEEYAARRASGEKWCVYCSGWHPVGSFQRDKSRSDGLSNRCRLGVKMMERRWQ